MSLLKVILRSLVYYRRSNAAVVLGAAVGVAVITGSLLVGDSATGSLRDLALQRLGRASHALTSGAFFREQLAADVAADETFRRRFHQCAPAIVLDAIATAPRSGVAIPRATVLGVDERFWRLGRAGAGPALNGREVAVNRMLARDLDIAVGDSVIVKVPRATGASAESLFGRRSPDQTLQSIRLTVSRIIGDEDLGGFTLRSDWPQPRNVYVALSWLQEQLAATAQVNTLLVAGEGGKPDDARAAGADELDDVLARSAALGDYGLRLVHNAARGYWSLESRRVVLEPGVVDAARQAATDLDVPATLTSVYLANRIALARGDDGTGGIPYSTVAAVDLAAPEPFGPLRSAGGEPLPEALKADEVLLNTWAADDLGARVGDAVRMEYYRVGADGTLADSGRRTFTLRGIVAMEGAGADRGLVPDIEGLTDVEGLDDWKPPFKVDMERIRVADDEYWERWRTTPKAFIAYEAARDLWRPERPVAGGTDLPWVTSVRIAPPDGSGPGDALNAFEAALLGRLSPRAGGLLFRPVKAEALRSAEGSTDFAGLFLGMSFFLVIVAAMLVGLLMRLSVEQRAREMGILLAEGFAPRAVGRVVVGEGALLAVGGALVGVPLGVAYAWLILAALRTWWVGALGPFTLTLHLTAASLVIGAVSGWLVAVAAAWWSARLVRKASPLALLAGWRALGRDLSPRWVPLCRTAGLLALAVVMALVILGVMGVLDATVAFFLIGPTFLAGLGCLMMLALVARPRSRCDAGRSWTVTSVRHLAAAGLGRQPVRSAATAGLIALATFAIVAVAANRVDFARGPADGGPPGAGGFGLVARSELPLAVSPATAEGRKALRFDAEAQRLLGGARIVPFRIHSGDDASCLNLQRPVAPRVVGVPGTLIERNAFLVVATFRGGGAEVGDNPWRLLLREADDGTVPAFADESSATWILRAGLGDVLTVSGRAGDVRLRLVGLLRGSIFQGDLLIAEDRFIEAFGPDGYRGLLVDVPEADVGGVALALRRNLGPLGFDVRRTGDVLADFAGVQNAYLATFHTLGGLALVLGVFAVVTVLLRNVVERRSELGMLLALGFRHRDVARLVVWESMTLVAAGLVMGTASGLVAVVPRLSAIRSGVPWGSLVLTVLGIAAAGYLACRIAADRAVGDDLLAAIRSE